MGQGLKKPSSGQSCCTIGVRKERRIFTWTFLVEPVLEKFHHVAQMAAEATRGQLSWSIGADARWAIESSGRGRTVAIAFESSSESSVILFFVGHQ